MDGSNGLLLAFSLVIGMFIGFIMVIVKSYGLSIFFVFYAFLIVCWSFASLYFFTLV